MNLGGFDGDHFSPFKIEYQKTLQTPTDKNGYLKLFYTNRPDVLQFSEMLKFPPIVLIELFHKIQYGSHFDRWQPFPHDTKMFSSSKPMPTKNSTAPSKGHQYVNCVNYVNWRLPRDLAPKLARESPCLKSLFPSRVRT